MVRVFVLNGFRMQSREALHLELRRQFSLPDYYGDNLDALWDLLSGAPGGHIVFQRAECVPKHLLLPLCGLLTDLVRQNPDWEFSLSTGSPCCHDRPKEAIAADADTSATDGAQAAAEAESPVAPLSPAGTATVQNGLPGRIVRKNQARGAHAPQAEDR